MEQAVGTRVPTAWMRADAWGEAPTPLGEESSPTVAVASRLDFILASARGAVTTLWLFP